VLKVLGPHELDKYSRNAAFVNKSRIFFDLETYYTFLYHRSIFYRCYTTLIYKAVYSGNVHGIVELPTGCPTSCPLSDTSGNPRGRAYGVPIGGTYWRYLSEPTKLGKCDSHMTLALRPVNTCRTPHDFVWWMWPFALFSSTQSKTHGHASEEWHQRRAAGNPQAGEIALADLMELGYSNPQEKTCNWTYWTLSMTSLFYLLCLFGVYYINVAGYTPQMWAPATLHHSSAEALPTLCSLIFAFWWTLSPLNWNVLFSLSSKWNWNYGYFPANVFTFQQMALGERWYSNWIIKDLDLEYHLSPSYPAKLVIG